MVRVHVKRHQGIIQEVEIRDHAGYADAGQDLVCAGVSSIAVGMMNAFDVCFLQNEVACFRHHLI